MEPLLNGDLLRVAEEAGFDLLLTTDKNLAYQQNLTGRKIAIVALGRNRWSLIQAALDQIADAVNARCLEVTLWWKSPLGKVFPYPVPSRRSAGTAFSYLRKNASKPRTPSSRT